MWRWKDYKIPPNPLPLLKPKQEKGLGQMKIMKVLIKTWSWGLIVMVNFFFFWHILYETICWRVSHILGTICVPILRCFSMHERPNQQFFMVIVIFILVFKQRPSRSCGNQIFLQWFPTSKAARRSVKKSLVLWLLDLPESCRSGAHQDSGKHRLQSPLAISSTHRDYPSTSSPYEVFSQQLIWQSWFLAFSHELL